MTSFLDGGVIYGTSRMWTNHLRSFVNGALRVTDDDFPALNNRMLPMNNHPVTVDHSLKPVSRLFGKLLDIIRINNYHNIKAV